MEGAQGVVSPSTLPPTKPTLGCSMPTVVSARTAVQTGTAAPELFSSITQVREGLKGKIHAFLCLPSFSFHPLPLPHQYMVWNFYDPTLLSASVHHPKWESELC